MTAATIVLKPPLSATQASPRLTVEQVRDRLSSVAISTVQGIVSDNARRMQGYMNETSLLQSGVYYSTDYFKALNAKKQTARIKFFVEKGNFFHGFASIKHFSMVPDSSMPTGRIPMRFVLLPHVKPSAALQAIREGLSLIDCGTTCKIGWYESLKDVLGVEKFDFLFSATSRTLFVIHMNSRKNPLDSLLIKTKDPTPEQFRKGGVIDFRNTPIYSWKHQNGELAGYVAICCDATPGSERFTTLGLPHEGITRAEIHQVMLMAFNEAPMGMEDVNKDVAEGIRGNTDQNLVTYWASRQITVEEFLDPLKMKEHVNLQGTKKGESVKGGGYMFVAMELNAARVAELVNSSFAGARSLLDKWDRENT